MSGTGTSAMNRLFGFSRQFWIAYPSHAGWSEFGLAYLAEYTMSGLWKEANPHDAAWAIALPVEYSKSMRLTVLGLVERDSPNRQGGPGGSWDGYYRR